MISKCPVNLQNWSWLELVLERGGGGEDNYGLGFVAFSVIARCKFMSIFTLCLAGILVDSVLRKL